MYAKKIVYLFLILAGLMLAGCGGGSSSVDDTLPDNNTTLPDDNTTLPDDNTTLPDENLTLDDFDDAVPHDPSFKSTHFSGSQNCAQCHDGITDTSNGKDVSIVQSWKGTMMDHAAIDPLYIAKVATEVQRNPDFKEVIEDKCSRCHMPMANVEAGFAGDPIAIFGDGFTNPNNPHYDAAKEGVSCTLCHQIENTVQLGTPEGFSGQFDINESFGTERVTYGPYKNPVTNPMINNVQFTPKHSAHMNDSKLCASCHNLDTPVIDIQTNALNGSIFPEQAVYTEWEYSDFNGTKSCQECHMPRTEGSVIISTKGNVGERTPFYQHKFLGANTYMLDILKNNRTKLGSVADTATFDKSITNTKEFLKASADVNITSTNFEDGTLEFSVKVTNHSGHKFPTSIPIRRAWLHVKVTNTADQTVVFESGAMNDNNQIIGVDDSSTSDFQEHHEEIDDASEVQVYEAIMLDTAGNQTYTFLNASSYAKDNRILPNGYKSTTPDSAQPYGEVLNDDDFVGGSDTVKYEVSSLPDSEYTITVTLKYQTVSYGFMQDLYKDANLTEVALMKVLDNNAQIRFEDISADTITIP